MGGRLVPWIKGKDRVGATDGSGQKLEKDYWNDSCEYDDEILELVSFDSMLDISLMKCKRVAQLQGPLEFVFTSGRRDLYLNIDGENFLVKGL